MIPDIDAFEPIYLLFCALGALIPLLFLVGVFFELRYKRAHSQRRSKNIWARAVGEFPQAYWMLLLWGLVVLALVNIFSDLPSILSNSLISLAVFAAILHSLQSEDAAVQPIHWLGGVLALILGLVAFLGSFSLDLPSAHLMEYAIPESIFEPFSEQSLLIFLVVLALAVSRRLRTGTVTPILFLGSIAGLGLTMLLFTPAYTWAIKTVLPSAGVSQSPWDWVYSMALSLFILILGGALAVLWVRPAGRSGRFGVAGAVGALAGGVLFSLLGAGVTGVFAQAPLFTFIPGYGGYPEAAWVYRLAISIDAVFPNFAVALWLMATGCGLVAGLGGLLVPQPEPNRRATIWPLGMLIGAAPGVFALTVIQVVILALLDPAVQTVLDLFGVSSGLIQNKILIISAGQTFLIWLALQALALFWLRCSQHPRIASPALAVLLTPLILFDLFLPTLNRYARFSVLILILFGLEWIAVCLEISRANLSDDDEKPGSASPRLDWITSGAAGGLLLGIVTQQFLAAMMSIVLIAVDLLTDLAKLEPLSIQRYMDSTIDAIMVNGVFGVGMLLGSMIGGACLGWLVSIWYQLEWLSGLWVRLARWQQSWSWPRKAATQRVIVALAGALLGLFIASPVQIPLLWLFVLGALFAVLLLRQFPIDGLSLPVIAVAFIIAASGFIGANSCNRCFFNLNTLLGRSVLGFLVAPVAGFSYWTFFRSRTRPARPLWRLSILIVLIALSGVFALGGGHTEIMGGVTAYDGESWQPLTVDHVPLENRLNFRFFTDQDGRLWTFNSTGLALLRTRDGWYPYILDSSHQDQAGSFLKLSADPHVVEDQRGRVWVAYNQILGHFNPDAAEEVFTPVQTSEDETLQSALEERYAMITGLVVDARGDLWLATRSDGVLWLQGGRPAAQSTWRFLTTDNSELISDKITGIYADQNGTLWLATLGGLARYDGDEWTHVTLPGLAEGEAVCCLYGDSRGHLWVGTDDSGFYWNGQNWKDFSAMPGWHQQAGAGSFYEDRRGHIWASVEGATWRFDGHQWAQILTDFQALAYAEAPGQVLWIGGIDGLVRYEVGTGIQARFDHENSGLPVDKVRDVYVDRDGMVWVSYFDVETKWRPPWWAVGVSVLPFAVLFGLVWRDRRSGL